MDKNACAQTVCTVTKNDLPLSCPPDGSVLWNAHPKVFLAIKASERVTCPYCGTRFVLVDESNNK